MAAPLRLTFLCLGVLIVINAADRKQAKLVREFKSNKPDLVDISNDGRWLLLQGQRSTKCEYKEGCSTPALTVYDIATGRRVDEITDVFYAPAFEQETIRTVRIRGLQKDRKDEDVLWRPGIGETVLGIYSPRMISYNSCRSDANLVTVDRPALLVSTEESIPLSSPPVRDWSGFEKHCAAWRNKSAFLLPGARSDETLYWVSAQPGIPYRPCRDFAPEHVLGYAVSPDASIIAVITGEGKSPETSGYVTRMNVLTAPDCQVLKRTELVISEKPEQKKQLLSPREKYRNNVPFSSIYMEYVAISPNNKLVAVAYGIWNDPNALAKVGLYSLDSSDRLTTVETGSGRCAIIRHMNNNWCEAPPVGPMRFSPDSRTLFTSSEHVQQWDISAFH